MSQAIPTRYCIYCQTERPWIFSGKRLKDGSKVYTDEVAARWAGRRCPDCERQRVQTALRCDRFERDLIVRQLEQNGYEVKGRSLPIKAEKDGETLLVGVRHAAAEGGSITLNKDRGPQADVYALVFSSVRIFAREDMERLEEQVATHRPPPPSIPREREEPAH